MIKSYLRKQLYKFLSGNKEYRLTEVGSRDKWNCKIEWIDTGSNVLSAGVGGAITFEKDLVNRTGCKILLLDPSPTGVQTMANPDNMHELIDYQVLGLAGNPGLIAFGKPDKLEEGSWKLGNVDTDETFHCKSVSSIMNEKNWKKLDLLKIDIEGFEYEVLNDILKNNLDIKQICVEFHVNTMIQIKQTKWDLLLILVRLRQHGYYLAHHVKMDYTFIKN